MSTVLWEWPPQELCSVKPIQPSRAALGCTGAGLLSLGSAASHLQKSHVGLCLPEFTPMGWQPVLTSTQHDSPSTVIAGTGATVLKLPWNFECHSKPVSALWVLSVGKEPRSAMMGVQGCCGLGEKSEGFH